jgi:cytochrome c-type biogenesis protein CcmH
MMIWMLLMVMTALAVLAVLWPLSRHRDAVDPAEPNAQFYRDQVAEIERDRERGLLSDAEAEAARAEAGRRLIRASATANPCVVALGEPALRRRRAVSALALSVVPILALAVYGAYGSPQLAGQPLSVRLKERPEELDLASALARIEAHLAKEPQDGRGWEVVAPVYLRIGRADDAVRAYEAALRLLGQEPTRLANYGEALVFAGDGIVSAEARAAFEKAIGLNPSTPKARFYLARAAEQDGNREQAKEEYSAILAFSPPDAPWAAVVKEQLARLDDSKGASVPNRAAIVGMVEGLAARLDAQGGSADEWTRLMRSYVVLGEPAKAKAAAEKARQALAQDQAAVRQIDAMANELKLADN